MAEFENLQCQQCKSVETENVHRSLSLIVMFLIKLFYV